MIDKGQCAIVVVVIWELDNGEVAWSDCGRDEVADIE